MAGDQTNYRDEIAAEIIARIEAGTAPWQRPWKAGTLGQSPFNPVSGNPYRGINAVWLDMQGHADPRWMTYKQAAAEGAQVLKGARSTVVEYWKFTEQVPSTDPDGNPVLDATGKPKTHEVRLDRPRVFLARVFNASQIEGLEPYIPPQAPDMPALVTAAENMIRTAGVPVHHDQVDRAFYRPATDQIHVPPVASFHDTAGYYDTVLHELGHATGHPSRLARDFGPFGSEGYAREELRAELASYMLSRELGISFDPSNHAAYVESWLKVLREDKNEIFRAARDAETIKTWVMEPERRPELERGAGQTRTAPAPSPEQPAPAQKAPPAAAQTAVMEVRHIDRLENYFRPGRIVPSYLGQDEVVAFRREGAMGWEVDVRAVSPFPSAKIRTHHTNPGEQLLAEWEKDNPTPAKPRIYLDVPFSDKDAAKMAGARWDKDAKSWYVPADLEPESFDRWLKVPQGLKYDVKKMEAAVTPEERREARGELIMTVGDLPEDRREEAIVFVRKYGITPEDVNKYVEYSEKQALEDRETDRAISEYLSRQDEIAEEHEFQKAERYEQAKDRTMQKTYIAVPFGEKDEAKAAGAKWDRQVKSWYVPEGLDPEPFAKWSAKTGPSEPALSPQEEFAEVLKANGLVVEGPPAMDGKWHRVATIDDKGHQKSGSYRGFLDGRPSGQITNYRGDDTIQWVATGSALTDEQRARIAAEAANVREARRQEQLALAERAAKTAYGVWNNLPGPATPENCAYLNAKGVLGHGVKVNAEGHMVIPARDAGGRLWTIQTVRPDSKLFLKESRKAGTMHVLEVTGKGTLESLAPLKRSTIVIAEGYATGATIHEATGHPVVIAFDKGNLKAVAEAVHAKFPDRPILIAADNDHALKENVGLIKAQEAAQAVGGAFVAPQFSQEEKAQKLTDFNDLAQSRGQAWIRRCVESALSKVRDQGLDRGVA